MPIPGGAGALHSTSTTRAEAHVIGSLDAALKRRSFTVVHAFMSFRTSFLGYNPAT
jgi:hypothetical protein